MFKKLTNKKEIIKILVVVIPLALVLGFAAGRSTAPLQRAMRVARRMSPKGDTNKIVALDILTAKRKFLDVALFTVEYDKTIQFIAMALGEAMIQQEMWFEAQTYLEMAYEILPGDFSVNYNLGVVYTSLYNLEQDEVLKWDYFDEAHERLTVALNSDPEDANAHYVMGMLLFYDYQYSEALTHFNAILNLFPNDIQAMLGAARIYYEQGNYDEARTIYLKLENALSVGDDKFRTVQENLEIINEAILEEGTTL